MTAFQKHHITTPDGDRVICRKQGEWSGKGREVVIDIKDPEKPMNVFRAKRLVEAISESIEAIPR